MRLFRIAIIAIVFILVLSTSSVFAVIYQDINWDGQMKVVGGIYTYDLEYNWDYGVAGSFVLGLWGVSPCVNDPIVNQTTKNRTTTSWTDWHVTIDNGYILVGSSNRIYNTSVAGPDWVISYEGLYDNGTKATGIMAHVVSGQGTQVRQNQSLKVNFGWQPIDIEYNTYIRQFPTADYPVPEPASLVSILAGIGTLGLAMKRRSK